MEPTIHLQNPDNYELDCYSIGANAKLMYSLYSALCDAPTIHLQNTDVHELYQIYIIFPKHLDSMQRAFMQGVVVLSVLALFTMYFFLVGN